MTETDKMFQGIPDAKATLDRRTAMWVSFVIIVFIAGLVLTLYLLTPKSVPWQISDGKLQIRSFVWDDEFPLGQLDTDSISIVDFNQDPSWRPQSKEYGYNGFGYDAGRFRLRNGRKVHLYLANENAAVLIPRHGDNLPVLIGVRDPAMFIATLHAAAR